MSGKKIGTASLDAPSSWRRVFRPELHTLSIASKVELAIFEPNLITSIRKKKK